jgi:hypothetical protein
MTEQNRPTLLASCARAASAAEASFRVPYPNSRARASRIFALDEGAAAALRAITEEDWAGARFLTAAARGGKDPNVVPIARFALQGPGGEPVRLADELAGADLVVLLAATGANAAAAEAIAREASARNIMTAGLALTDGLARPEVEKVVNCLRPYASVLAVASDNDFIAAMLTALRA